MVNAETQSRMLLCTLSNIADWQAHHLKSACTIKQLIQLHSEHGTVTRCCRWAGEERTPKMLVQGAPLHGAAAAAQRRPACVSWRHGYATLESPLSAVAGHRRSRLCAVRALTLHRRCPGDPTS
jgi:hypothetical protein